MRAWLSPSAGRDPHDVELLLGRSGAAPDIGILVPGARTPWSGHMALYAMPEVYAAISQHGTTIVFLHTRPQAETCFQALWHPKQEGQPSALQPRRHHTQHRTKPPAPTAST